MDGAVSSAFHRTVRRILFCIGLLLPLSVSAEALSPWVTEAIKRSEDGIGMARGIEYTNCDEGALLAEHQTNQSLLKQFADVQLDFGMEATFLRERTVCFENDRDMLREQIAKVASTLLEETKACKLGTAGVLRKNYEFLQNAYRFFLEGAVDPSFRTPILMQNWMFHDRALYDAGTSSKPRDDAPTDWQCPFFTDYGAHALAYIPLEPGSGASGEDLSVRSYGCDQSVLDRIKGLNANEASTLSFFLGQTDTAARGLYKTLQDALFALGSALSARTEGWAPPKLPAIPDTAPDHASLSGCLRPEEPVDGRYTGEDIEALLLTYPDYFEEKYLQERSIGGQSRLSFGPDEAHRLPIGLLSRSTLDYFSTQPSASSLLRAFAERRLRTAAERPFSWFFTPKPITSIFAIFENVMKESTDVKQVERSIEEEIGFLDSAVRDASERMRSAGSPLEDALQSLLAVTNSSDGLLPTVYIPDLTYFLARSCVDGHCQQTLKTVAKRTFNPYCTPYVSGKFTEPDAAKKCFCDNSIKDTWNDWDKYCSDEVPSTLDRKPDEMQVMCVEQL